MAEPKTLTLYILDIIGDSWFGGVDQKEISRALIEAGPVDEIVVHINSPGGSVWDGLGIYNALKNHPAKVTVKIDGIAASAASLIAMAGDVVEMPANTLMMIHNPWTIAMGEAKEFRKVADSLDKHRDAAAETYAMKTGKPASEYHAIMDAETWLSAEEAVEAGLADLVTGRTTERDDDANASSAMTVRAKAFAERAFNKVPAAAAGFFHPTRADAGRDTLLKGIAAMAGNTKPKNENGKDGEQTPGTEPEKGTPKAEEGQAVAGTLELVSASPLIDTEAEVKKGVEAALKADRERQSEIRSMCRLAGYDAVKADEFCASGSSVEEVRSALFEQMCKDREPSNSDASASATGGGEAPRDPYAKYREEYAANKADHTAFGTSEESYVRSRCLDDGIEPPAKAA